MSTIRLLTARSGMEAHLVRQWLESHGLRAVVHGEPLAQASLDVLGFDPASGPSVWVHREDHAEAQRLLADYREGGNADAADPLLRDPWLCPECDEIIEPEFAICWNCGHDPATGMLDEGTDQHPDA